MHQVWRFFCDCDCDFLTQGVKNRSDTFWIPKKCPPPPPPESLAISSCDEKSLAIVIFSIFEENGVLIGLVGNGDVCDKKWRRFAIAILGALSFI